MEFSFTPVPVKGAANRRALGRHVDKTICAGVAFQHADLGVGRYHLTAIGAFHRIYFAKGQQAFSANHRAEQVDFLLLILNGGGQINNPATALRANICSIDRHINRPKNSGSLPYNIVTCIITRQFYHNQKRPDTWHSVQLN